MKKKSVCPSPYLRNHTSYDSHLWYTFVKRLYLQVFFSFFQKFDFLGRQGDQRAKNGPKWQQILCCTLYFIFQDPWIIWSSFIVDMCKRIIFPDIFFSIFEMEKNDPKWKKLCCIPSQELYIIRLSFLVHMCKMMISRGIFSF